WWRSRATNLPVGRILDGVPVATLADACIGVAVGRGACSRRVLFGIGGGLLGVACKDWPAGVAGWASFRAGGGCAGCRVVVAGARLVARDCFLTGVGGAGCVSAAVSRSIPKMAPS